MLMDELALSPCQKQNVQTPNRKSLSFKSAKDLWLIVREGSVSDLESALVSLKRNGGNINSRNAFGLTALHIATWRNHMPIVRRLLAAGADPNARDGESGWSSLHRALHFGHLAVASFLLQSGASLSLEDTKGRTPIDLLSGPVCQVVGKGQNTVATELFSWGSGVNYQLGTGNAHIQKLPCKVDSLHDSFIKLVSASKFHSVAVSGRGEVYTWGFGRGGRLGHPDFDIHSGQAAVITPRQVTSSLGARRIKAIAAAKHHTVAATESGEVFTWGSNREGQLGYTSVDSQPTPRRVSALKSRIVGVAAANKHTAVISELGEVFTWGCNKEGQLGYGTSNSASNYTPRLVEYLKGKEFIEVAAAKYHTVVLGTDGEVFTWGHRLVTPRRILLARMPRNSRKLGSTQLKFHHKERLHIVAIAAGMVHSLALADDGAVFYWVSSDPDLHCQQLYSLCGKSVVSISSGKYWSAVVTASGDVYTWDGKNAKNKTPVLSRLHGVKKATSVSVGETHLLVVSSLYHPAYLRKLVDNCPTPKTNIQDELAELDERFFLNEIEQEEVLCRTRKEDLMSRTTPSLKSLCEEVAAKHLVEPRNAIQLLEIADTLGADDLKKHCEEIAVRNLDYIFMVSPHAIAETSVDILVNLENLLDSKSSEPWSYRQLPTPTATFPAVVHSEDEGSDSEVLRTRSNSVDRTILREERGDILDRFLQSHKGSQECTSKEIRALRKKLQQIEMLEQKQSNGHPLDDQQIAKLRTKPLLEKALLDRGVAVETMEMKASSSASSEGKGNKKGDMPRKQRRKSKQKAVPVEEVTGASEVLIQPNPLKDLQEGKITEMKHKELSLERAPADLPDDDTKDISVPNKNDSLSTAKCQSLPTVAPKKKNRKGGLSMFLSGALDNVQIQVPPPPPVLPKNEGPAWGGAKVSTRSASLREIQDEQCKRKDMNPLRRSDQVEDHSDGNAAGKLRLASFLPSSPIPMASSHAPIASDGDKCTPPWAASLTPPLSRPSLRDIQMQQGKQQGHSHSPKTRTAGFSVSSGQGSPSDSSGPNRWFKPETETPSSIRSIQIEERAIKDLKRFYSSVRVVKNHS